MSVKYFHASGHRRRTFLFTTLSLLALDLASSPAWAADGAKAAAPADPVVATAVTGAAAVTDSAEPIEVLVTARRREEKAQDVPIAITALGGNFLKKTDDVRLAQDVVSFAPNITAAATDGRDRPRWFIRGVGTNNTDANGVSQIGVYRDEVYIANFYAQAFPLFDQERVEVLSGPQGTLWGKNTTGGAVSYISKAPSFETGGYAKITTGSFGQEGYEGAITGALIPHQLAGRLSYYHDQDDGWQKNLYNGDVTPAQANTWNTANAKTVGANNETDVRGQLLYTPTDNLKILVSAHDRNYYGDETPSYILPVTYSASPTNPVYNLGYTSPSHPLPYGDIWAADVGHESVRDDGGLVRVNWDFGGLSLTEITGYEQNKLVRVVNGSQVIPLDNSVSRQQTPDRQFSDELRLASSASDRFNWIVGAYYFDEHNVSETWAGNLNIYTSPASVRSYSDTYTATHTESSALFGSATYDLTDKFKITAGGRLNTETKTYGQAFTLGTGTVTFSNPALWWYEGSVSSPLVTNSVDSIKKTYNSFTYDVTPQYKISDTASAYFHYSYGYLSGGFDSKRITSVSPNVLQIDPYQPERIYTYELGLKTQWWDKRITSNFSAFYYDYPSIQVLVILPSTGVNTNSATVAVGTGYANAAGWIKGFEWTADARPDDHWHLRSAIGLLDSKYTSYPIQSGVNYPGAGLVNATINPSGGVFTRAPKVTLSLGADYTQPIGSYGDINAGLDYRYLSKQYYNPTVEFDQTLAQPAYGLLGGHVAWEFGRGNRYRLTLTGDNLSDTKYLIHAIVPTNNGSSAREGTPRSYLLSLSADF